MDKIFVVAVDDGVFRWILASFLLLGVDLGDACDGLLLLLSLLLLLHTQSVIILIIILFHLQPRTCDSLTRW